MQNIGSEMRGVVKLKPQSARANSAKSARKSAPNGAIRFWELLKTLKFRLPGEGRGPILFADQQVAKLGYRPSPVRQGFLEVP